MVAVAGNVAHVTITWRAPNAPAGHTEPLRHAGERSNEAAFRAAARQRGLSLVELLVAMAIGLILTLAIATVMTISEGSKRSITSTNDISQTGAYVTYTLDRALRSAGSGYAQRWNEVVRLPASMRRATTPSILPRAGALPAPSPR